MAGTRENLTEDIHNLNCDSSLTQFHWDYTGWGIQPIISKVLLPDNVCIHNSDHLSLETFVTQIDAISAGSWIYALTPVEMVMCK